jgi:hypothetical protein
MADPNARRVRHRPPIYAQSIGQARATRSPIRQLRQFPAAQEAITADTVQGPRFKKIKINILKV